MLIEDFHLSEKVPSTAWHQLSQIFVSFISLLDLIFLTSISFKDRLIACFEALLKLVWSVLASDCSRMTNP